MLSGKAKLLIPTVKETENEEKGLDFVEVDEIHAGTGFGELALIKDIPRSGSVQCVEDCELAILSKEDYLRILGKAEINKLDELISFFQSIPMFKN